MSLRRTNFVVTENDLEYKAWGGVHLNALDTAHKRPNDLVLERLL